MKDYGQHNGDFSVVQSVSRVRVIGIVILIGIG